MTSMPELRRDPLSGSWVVIAGDRDARPNLPAQCPFCVGGLEAPEPYVVKAFPNRWAPLVAGSPNPTPEDGDVAVGAAEVVLYSPDHEVTFSTLGTAQARLVVDLWAERTEALLARPEVAYVLVFENRGASVGQTIYHPHGQIYGFPFVPPAVEREIALTKDGCALCSSPADELRVASVEGWTASVPHAAGYPYEVVLAPGRHVGSLAELSDAERDGLADGLTAVLGGYDALFDMTFPYMYWIHPGSHLHVHIVAPLRGVRPDGTGIARYVAAGELGSGVLFNPVPPERAAAALRAVTRSGSHRPQA
jgi:UDPglucose--hexose-1-phosphate uridylyltransferase